MKVVNFFAGPGAGKSTAAAGLFYVMKNHGESVELVREYAKELTYDLDHDTLADQQAVFEEQLRRQVIILGEVDYLITDSPLLMSSVYGPHYPASFHREVEASFDAYENINIFVRAKKPYQTYGRSQTESEARAIDLRVRSILGDRPVFEVDGDMDAPWKVYNHLIRERCSNSESI
jgi:hypothetical protein